MADGGNRASAAADVPEAALPARGIGHGRCYDVSRIRGGEVMPRVRTRFPTVFVGHPFGHRFATKKFRKLFQDLPFKVIYGNTDLQTKHLLRIMKDNISNSDYSIFDLSDWNANVSLELGLAEGLKKKSEVDYYILLNNRRSRNVPSDLQGMQRLEYTRYDYRPEVGLGDLLIKYVLVKEHWVKQISKGFSGDKKKDDKLFLSLRILAYLRDNQKLATENLRTLARGKYLRKPDWENVLDVLRRLKLIRKVYGASVYRLGHSLF
jgi:hypothetical protein